MLFTKDVDIELRIVCEQFIQNVSESLISPLSAFLTKVNVVLLFRHATAGDGGQENSCLEMWSFMFDITFSSVFLKQTSLF